MKTIKTLTPIDILCAITDYLNRVHQQSGETINISHYNLDYIISGGEEAPFNNVELRLTSMNP